jgi:hypothetical protein
MDFHDQHKLETYKSMVTISLEAIRTLFLLNGGAIVALLAYLGQVAAKGGPSVDISRPLTFFIVGLSLVPVAYGFSYWTQFSLFNEAVHRKNEERHMWFVVCTVVSLVASLAGFILGAIDGARALSATSA